MSMKESPTLLKTEGVNMCNIQHKMDITSKTRAELITMCKNAGIRGYSDKNKPALVKLLSAKCERSISTPVSTTTVISTPTFIEVCAGCGGLSSGFIEAGFTPLLLNEIDKTSCATLRKNHPGAHIVCGDMEQLDLTPFRGKVDVLQGGVPCQAFSHAGERRGLADPRGALIVKFNQLINDCKPKVFLVENVKGLVTHAGGSTFRDILELFANDGQYRVYHKVLNAKDYAVPQKRERVFIVGVHSSIAENFEFPEPSATQVFLRDVLGGVRGDVPSTLGAKYSAEKAHIMAMVPPGGCWVDLPKHVQLQYMGKAGLATSGGKRGVARRLSMDEQCLTLTTSPCQKQTERCHPIETRPLTVREYARIQTFADTYEFEGGMNSQYKQIGNAVPVKLAAAMAKKIRHFLEQS